MSGPPNTRMQRTRSSASPPRSPLMRSPLGGLWRNRRLAHLVFVSVACLVSGCVSYRGKMYWAWAVPGWPIEAACEASREGTGSVVHIAVLDEADGPLPGVAVQVGRADSQPGFQGATDDHGVVTTALEPGQYQVTVRLAGFTHRECALSLARDQSCTITFHLAIDSRASIGVV